MLNSYQKAAKRLILLDYDGTLAPLVSQPALASPDKALLKLLEDLTSNARNTVYIISGRDKGTLSEWLGHLNLNFVAEHGAWIRPDNECWQNSAALTTGWKPRVNEILEKYAGSCAGSFVENKSFSLAWHYRRAEPETAVPAVNSVLAELHPVVSALDLEIIDGNKVIEVRNRGISKGKAVKEILAKTDFDFILACGDDTTDEDMFRELIGVDHAITIKVGEGRSLAKMRVADTVTISSLLKTLTVSDTLNG